MPSTGNSQILWASEVMDLVGEPRPITLLNQYNPNYILNSYH